MVSTIFGKRLAKKRPPAGQTPPPPEARTVDSNSNSEDGFDDGADWLDDPATLSEFKAAEKAHSRLQHPAISANARILQSSY
jgi:hypothetical protein